MHEKIEITLVFYEPTEEGGLEVKEFSAKLNTVASIEMLLPALLEAYEDSVDMGDVTQVQVALQIPSSVSLSEVDVVNDSRIIIMPKIIPGEKLVERND